MDNSRLVSPCALLVFVLVTALSIGGFFLVCNGTERQDRALLDSAVRSGRTAAAELGPEPPAAAPQRLVLHFELGRHRGGLRPAGEISVGRAGIVDRLGRQCRCATARRGGSGHRPQSPPTTAGFAGALRGAGRTDIVGDDRPPGGDAVAGAGGIIDRLPPRGVPDAVGPPSEGSHGEHEQGVLAHLCQRLRLPQTRAGATDRQHIRSWAVAEPRRQRRAPVRLPALARAGIAEVVVCRARMRRRRRGSCSGSGWRWRSRSPSSSRSWPDASATPRPSWPSAPPRSLALQQELVRSERLAALGEFAAVVGHELRNPLERR